MSRGVSPLTYRLMLSSVLSMSEQDARIKVQELPRDAAHARKLNEEQRGLGRSVRPAQHVALSGLVDLPGMRVLARGHHIHLYVVGAKLERCGFHQPKRARFR